ncbi:MAG TPA: hypothetical protein VGD31_05170 [Sphingobacteriaceae bacterium]
MRVLYFLNLVISALALSTTSAHVLEYPQKIKLDIPAYTLINSNLYKFFALVGGLYCIGAIVLALILVYVSRKQRNILRWNFWGLAFHLLWLVSWILIVNSVNSQIVDNPDAAHQLWEQLRYRWEYGHIVGFVFHLGAFCCLTIGALNMGRDRIDH